MSDSDLEPTAPPPSPGREPERTTRRARVAIVGAGISGLACARDLADHGCWVTLLDKGRRPGGRCNTRDSRDHPDRRFDHGAQYFTARDPRFIRLIETLHARDRVTRWSVPTARIRRMADGRVAVDLDPPDMDPPRWVGLPDMQGFAAGLAGDLDGEAELRCGVRVEGITRADAAGDTALSGSPGWMLSTDAGAVGSFDAVVVTAPPAQAAALFETVGDEVGRALATEARSCEVAPCWAAMLEWSDGAHAPRVEFEAAQVEAAGLSWITRDSSRPGRVDAARWVVHASPEFSSDHLEDDPDRMAELLGARFCDLIAEAGSARPDAPDWSAGHRWRYARPLSGPDVPCRADPTGLVWCGDVFEAAGRGRIEAAWASGVAAAGRLIGFLRASSTSPVSDRVDPVAPGPPVA